MTRCQQVTDGAAHERPGQAHGDGAEASDGVVPGDQEARHRSRDALRVPGSGELGDGARGGDPTDLVPLASVNHMAPSGPGAMPNRLPFGLGMGNSVMAPLGVIRPI